jgi:hypothetical protein
MKKLTSFKITLSLAVIVFLSCNKIHEELHDFFDKDQTPSKQANKYSSDVLIKWLDLKYRIIQQPTQILKPGFTDPYINRYFAYIGIALYESVVPGMPSYKSLSGQLSDMPQIPKPEKGKQYHWPASANAALAFIHKGLLYSITAANKSSVDSLEEALNVQYRNEVDAATFQRSVAFGREVAKRILEWSETDNAFKVYPPYVPPTGPGLWVPTPPNFAAPTGAYRGDLRPLMPGVLTKVLPAPPPPYSTAPSSKFYKIQKEVYDVSQTLTAEQIAQAQYWRQNSIHWFAIFRKVLAEQSAKLDIAALAYCKMGITLSDASIATFKAKYTYNLPRPITYIRNVLGYTSWNSLFPALPNPDYPDGVVADYSASAGALSSVFGKSYLLNTQGTNPQSLQGYTFNSFEDAAVHGGLSRFFAGVTTRPFVESGLEIGFKTVQYMEKNIEFKK